MLTAYDEEATVSKRLRRASAIVFSRIRGEIAGIKNVGCADDVESSRKAVAGGFNIISFYQPNRSDSLAHQAEWLGISAAG
jgi:hypothetical protein